MPILSAAPAADAAPAASVAQAPDTIPVCATWVGSWRVSLERRPWEAAALAHRYDRAAAGWQKTLDRLGIGPAYEALLRLVLQSAPDVPPDLAPGITEARPMRVLDCGTGTGALSLALARTAQAPLALDAVDLSPAMLFEARRTFTRRGLDVALRCADVRHLPYEDGTFDMAMTAHLVEHLADPAAALSEIARVVRPGGLIVAGLTRRSPLGLYVHLKWRTHLVTPAAAETWMHQAGLDNVRCLSLPPRGFLPRLSLACAARKPA